LTNYRQVGGKLGAYIRANKPTTQQIQGVLADLLAGDRLLPTMREVATMPAFAELQRLAGNGAGSVQRDSLLQDLAVRYLPVVLDDVCQLVNGMLDLPVGQSVSSSTTALTSEPRPRYRQNSLPIGPAAPAPTLYGPAQPLPASMQLAEQGLLDVHSLGPLFDNLRESQHITDSNPAFH